MKTILAFALFLPSLCFAQADSLSIPEDLRNEIRVRAQTFTSLTEKVAINYFSVVQASLEVEDEDPDHRQMKERSKERDTLRLDRDLLPLIEFIAESPFPSIESYELSAERILAIMEKLRNNILPELVAADLFNAEEEVLKSLYERYSMGKTRNQLRLDFVLNCLIKDFEKRSDRKVVLPQIK